MSDEAAKHAVLLDALEAAGFPRASLVGAGNAIVWNAGDIIFEQRGERVHSTIKSGGATLTFDMNKFGARQLGAFLLAWGHAP